MPHLLLQLKDPIHQRLGRWRTARNIDIDRHDPITSPRDRVAIVIVPATVRTAAHRDHPARLGHLVVHLAQGRRHLVGERAGDDHDVGLARARAEDDAHAVLVVAGRGQVHHLDGAAGEAEGHGPEGALAGPVGDLVERCSVDFELTNLIRAVWVSVFLNSSELDCIGLCHVWDEVKVLGFFGNVQGILNRSLCPLLAWKRNVCR